MILLLGCFIKLNSLGISLLTIGFSDKLEKLTLTSFSVRVLPKNVASEFLLSNPTFIQKYITGIQKRFFQN